MHSTTHARTNRHSAGLTLCCFLAAPHTQLAATEQHLAAVQMQLACAWREIEYVCDQRAVEQEWRVKVRQKSNRPQ
jgi:hypothetical protein